MDNFGARIGQARKEAGLSFKELSRLSGTSVGYLCDLENGKVKNPTLKTLRRVESLLGELVLAEELALDSGVGLGERLRKLRHQRGLGQQAIGDMLDVGRSTYGKWENEHSHPSLKKLVALADILDVSVDFLLGRQTIESFPTGGIRRALEVAQTLIEHALKSLPELQAPADEIEHDTQ